MTTELFWLTLTMGLAASLWLPFIILVNTTAAGTAVDNGLARYTDMGRAAQLANRAHLNLLEQGMPFAALVLLAVLVDAEAEEPPVRLLPVRRPRPHVRPDQPPRQDVRVLLHLWKPSQASY